MDRKERERGGESGIVVRMVVWSKGKEAYG
jgi:hypothetical protein